MASSLDLGTAKNKIKLSPKYEYVITTTRAAEIAPILNEYKTLAIDTETTGLDPFLSEIILLQIGTVDGKAYVFDARTVDISVLRASLENPDIIKLLANAKFDYQMLRIAKNGAGIELNNIYDAMLAEEVLTAGLEYSASLASMCAKYVGVPLDKTIRNEFEDFTRNDTATFKAPFTSEQLEYAAVDVYIMHTIFESQLRALEKENLLDTAKLEFDVCIPIAEMELHGVYIDPNKWVSILEEVEIERKAKEKVLHSLAEPYSEQQGLFGASSTNFSSPAQMVKLFKRMGVDVRGEEVFDTNSSTLETINHPFARELLEYRGYDKVIKAFGQKLLQRINPKTKRLHPSFRQIIRTGRMSCSGPNLQQIPAKGSGPGTKIRECFVAPAGYKLLVADYSQCELRILAELSQDPVMMNAYIKGIDLHTDTASRIWGIPFDKVPKAQRSIAKTINFLLVYGGGPSTLAARAAISEDEAEALINVYFSIYKGVKAYLANSGKAALLNRYSKTILGRKRFFSIPTQDNPEFKRIRSSVEREGKNQPIQGTNADITKRAMYYIHRDIKRNNLKSHILFPVHDEILIESPEVEVEQVALIQKNCMEAAFADFVKSIPNKVDVMVCDYWKKD